MKIVAVLLTMLLAGCATTDAVNVSVQGDSYCKIGEKWRWSINDTAPTIAQARRVNAKRDRLCGRKKS